MIQETSENKVRFSLSKLIVSYTIFSQHWCFFIFCDLRVEFLSHISNFISKIRAYTWLNSLTNFWAKFYLARRSFCTRRIAVSNRALICQEKYL